MIKFEKSLNAFSKPNFNTVLKQQLLDLNIDYMPLYKLTTQGGKIDNKNINFSIYSSKELERCIQIKIAVFFDELVAGCSCGDPIIKIANNSEMFLQINNLTAEINFKII